MNKSYVATLCTFMAAILLLAFGSSNAFCAGLETRDICLCRQVIARTLCKSPGEIEYIDRYMDTRNYSFTVFYANKRTGFVCRVNESEVRIKGEAWAPLLRTVEIVDQQQTGCALLDYSLPECPKGPTRCCIPLSEEEIERRKDADFWNRPVPELLEEELRSGIARDEDAANETAPTEPAPAEDGQ